ncbi:adenylate kinase family protein [Methanobrevibacter curvatus]|uniref:Putative adenylate kinase n=1 Tax=Methanobrevibacter curvatus TaxID=49547 RepID=A0A166BV13_9EURY|nr:adenylate kinase family protein [Methanobrevibacter curvatus]KZX13843.1 putative kinase [Methanobrevibacter curvatus]
MFKTVFISGTPGTGKTTLINKLKNSLSDYYNLDLLDINKIAIDNNFILEINEDKDYKVVDIDKLNLKILKIIELKKQEFNNSTRDKTSRIILVDGHISHLCDGADLLIILRSNPKILNERLNLRGYSPSKIKDNLESESLAICSNEAYEKYKERVNEIDTSIISSDEMTKIAIEIIEDKISCPVGKIDYLDWFLNK